MSSELIRFVIKHQFHRDILIIAKVSPIQIKKPEGSIEIYRHNSVVWIIRKNFKNLQVDCIESFFIRSVELPQQKLGLIKNKNSEQAPLELKNRAYLAIDKTSSHRVYVLILMFYFYIICRQVYLKFIQRGWALKFVVSYSGILKQTVACDSAQWNILIRNLGLTRGTVLKGTV